MPTPAFKSLKVDSYGMLSDEYHRWYYDQRIWLETTFLGVQTQKSVSDLWNYQEIIWELKPDLIVEFGAHSGGSTLFFSAILRLINPHGIVLSIDVDLSRIAQRARENSSVRFLESNSVDPRVAEEIRSLRARKPGPMFCIVDSDHSKSHVLAELELLRDVTRRGDYLVVEDGNLNGHPVMPDWGEGPYEALEQYASDYPGDYKRDEVREHKFGWTFAVGGFLTRL